MWKTPWPPSRPARILLGFVLWEKSPRHVTMEKAREIARQLPPGTARVGVFVDATVEQVMFSLRICDFSALQFHGQESPAYCRQFGVMTIKAFRIRDAASLEALSAYRHGCLFARQPGGGAAGRDREDFRLVAGRGGKKV
jgi:phosphoribosylanthranilate isomerase